MSEPVLYTETRGNGPSVVLLHGWGMNLRVFDALRDALATRYAVTTVDLAGHGRSAWRTSLDATEQLAALAAVTPPGAALIGWSLGGQFALQLAARASLRVRALVLIASTPRFVSNAAWSFGLPLATLRQFALALARDPQRTVAEFLELQVRGSAAAQTTLATLQAALDAHGSAVPAALTAGMQLLEHNDLRALARTLPVHCLAIAGRYDRVTPPQAAQALVQSMPRAEIMLLARAGHAPFLSHPDAVADALHVFLGRTLPIDRREAAR